MDGEMDGYGCMDGLRDAACVYVGISCMLCALLWERGGSGAFPVTRLLGERIPKRSLSLLASFGGLGLGLGFRISAFEASKRVRW